MIDSLGSQSNTAVRSVLAAIAHAVAHHENEIDISWPDRLYMTDSQSQLFDIATSKDPKYETYVDQPIINLIDLHKHSLFSSIINQAIFVDLGPGYPTKSLRIIDYLISRSIDITYITVDISKYFLERSAVAVAHRGVRVIKLLKRFEDIEHVFDYSLFHGIPRIFFLGFTFCNFEISSICSILGKLVHANDICLICTQSPQIGEPELLQPYTEDKMKLFCFESLKELGISIEDLLYYPRFKSNCVELIFQSKRKLRLDEVVMPEGVKLITAKSYRLPNVELYNTIKKHLEHVCTYTDPLSNISLICVAGLD